MSETQANQSNENTATNPTTEGSKNNVSDKYDNIPQERFDKVIGERNQLRSDMDSIKNELAKMKETTELKKKESLQKQGEFEKLWMDEQNTNKSLQAKLETQNQFIGEYRTAQIEKLPEDKREFAQSLSDDKFNQYISLEKNNVVNTKSTDSSRPSAEKEVGEFGGYNSQMEWLEKDPEGYEKDYNSRKQTDKWGAMFSSKPNPYAQE